MVKTKKAKKGQSDEEYSDEEMDDDVAGEEFIDDLDDEEPEDEKGKGVPEIEPKWRKEMDKVLSIVSNHNSAITINQKYIKKIWEKVKEQENNFKLLYESK